ncbi:MAG: hypothetical protein ACD_58C00343G0005 [uncultured bacterium]|nr:MAG: hypothetical protein ACD_58C00343G0005 [uncultured bacterium]
MVNRNFEDFQERTFNFAVKVVKLVLKLPNNSATWILGKQLIASATSIDSNVDQAKSGVSRPDFINHMKIARKEAKETLRWIKMLIALNLFKAEDLVEVINENEEIIKILISSIKTAEKNK